MIEASFDRMSRAAAISGAYQYDTGQRLRLSGLPSPDEFAQMDDLVSGSVVAVQAHYSYAGDSTSEMRLAQYDEWRGAWIAEIPDEYMTRSEPVYVHVYVYYGESAEALMLLGDGETNARAQTMYEGVFTPKSRPAPSGTVTDEQLEAWMAYKEDIDIELTNAGASVTRAQNAAASALTAAQAAGEAAKTAQEAAANTEAATDKLTNAANRVTLAQHSVISLAPGNGATAMIYQNTVTLGVTQGEKGETGDAGADGPSDITIAFSGGTLTITPKEG